MMGYTVRVYSDGSKEYFLNGKLHKEDGPAVEYTNGYKAWYKNGKPYNENGPVVIHPNGDKEYFVNKEEVKQEITVNGFTYRLVEK